MKIEPLDDALPGEVVAWMPGAHDDLGCLEASARVVDRPEYGNAIDLDTVEHRVVIEEPEEIPGRMFGVDRANGLHGLAAEATGTDHHERSYRSIRGGHRYSDPSPAASLTTAITRSCCSSVIAWKTGSRSDRPVRCSVTGSGA